MSKFTGQLDVVFDDQWATLKEPLEWDCDELGSEETVVVPGGFRSDGASVPRPFWFFMPPWGDKATRAAILHDYLLKMLDKGTPIGTCTNRARCDHQLYLALLALDVPEWRATVIWSGVRVFSICVDIGRQIGVLKNPEVYGI